MATLPAIELSYGIEKKSRPSVRIAQFGSGYSHRTTFGLNQSPKEWTLQWANITEADADTLEAFFEARAGVEAFEWTPPDDSTEYKWICSEWSKTIDLPTRRTLNATFQQVFEP